MIVLIRSEKAVFGFYSDQPAICAQAVTAYEVKQKLKYMKDNFSHLLDTKSGGDGLGAS